MVSRNAALWLFSACFRGETQMVAYLVPLISLSMHLRCTSIIHLLAQCDSVPAYLSKRSTGIIPVVSVNRLAKNETLFSVHVPYGVPKANYCRSPIPIRPVTYVRVHRNNSGAAGSACEYAHHHHHYHLGCQKTRWHLKERSRGQEASLALPKRPYREMRFPFPFLFPSTRPYYLLRATARHPGPFSSSLSSDNLAIIPPPRRAPLPSGSLLPPPCGSCCGPYRQHT